MHGMLQVQSINAAYTKKDVKKLTKGALVSEQMHKHMLPQKL